MSLSGITRAGASSIKNPKIHNPVPMQNRIRLEVWGPDERGLKGKGRKRKKMQSEEVPQLVCKAVREHVGNIMATFGLNNLCELVATGGEASSWVSVGRIGTHTQAEVSTDDTLGASTASVVITAASMDVSDQGDRTLRYAMTFASDNPAGAAEIHEVGLFCNSTAHSQMAARTELGTDNVNKGASDEIRISYDIIFTTA